jgi:PIF1-like helicase
MIEQLDYCRKEELILAEQCILIMNIEQLNTFNKIFTSTSQNLGQIFFLHGSGRTGKTFVYQALCHHVCGNEWIALCVALSSITTLLLPDSYTTHLTFSIPV